MTTILLVDDSRTMRKVIINRIAESGLPVGRILEAGHGKAALEVLAVETVDIIVTDINMPVMNGLDFISGVRANPALNEIPIIVVSTEGVGPMGKEAVMRGANNLLRKPFSAADVRVMLTPYLSPPSPSVDRV